MKRKRILIFDELPFARVCSALLENAGHEVEVISAVDDLPSSRDIRKFGLIITSYPFCTAFFGTIRKFGISTIILSDDIDEKLFEVLKDADNYYCMMKPLDYGKFRSLVRKVIDSEKVTQGGSHYLV